MLLHRLDTDSATAVWYFFGTENSDDDFERYVASLRDLKKYVVAPTKGTGLMLVDRNNPAPNAMWRKRIAEASADIGSNNVYALVAESVAIRGVLTAINWLRPPRYDFRVASNVEDALAWIELRRGHGVVELLRRHLAELREQSSSTRSGPR